MIRFILVLLIIETAVYVHASTLDDIDKAVEHLGAFIIRSIPDKAEQNIAIAPFFSDERGRNILGDRLKSELELYLASEYLKTRIVVQPEGLNTYTITGEIQAYPGKVRIICKIVKPDGSLGGGSKIDIPATPEIEALLLPAGKPPEGTYGREGYFAADEDPYEPDDIQGFEVEVNKIGISSFERIITPGDIDRFRFYLPHPRTVVLETITDIDTQLLIFREGENIPFQVSDNIHASGSRRIETFLEEGYYIVEVLAYDFNIQGNYTMVINLSGKDNDEFEPDNTIEEAKYILPNSQQERILLSGDEDWVELSFNIPGFYAVYSSGKQIDTIISLYVEEKNRFLIDDNSGELFNAYLGLFLGTRRTFARISAKKPIESGSYTLGFEKIEPLQIYPNGSVQEIQAQQKPHYARLRILQSDNYLISKLGEQNPVTSELYTLPNMKLIEEDSKADSLYFLSPGDYLLVLKSKEAENIRLCVASEETAENCKRSIKE